MINFEFNLIKKYTKKLIFSFSKKYLENCKKYLEYTNKYLENTIKYLVYEKKYLVILSAIYINYLLS